MEKFLIYKDDLTLLIGVPQFFRLFYFPPNQIPAKKSSQSRFPPIQFSTKITPAKEITARKFPAEKMAAKKFSTTNLDSHQAF